MQSGYADVFTASFCVKSETVDIKVTGPLSADLLT